MFAETLIKSVIPQTPNHINFYIKLVVLSLDTIIYIFLILGEDERGQCHIQICVLCRSTTRLHLFIPEKIDIFQRWDSALQSL